MKRTTVIPTRAAGFPPDSSGPGRGVPRGLPIDRDSIPPAARLAFSLLEMMIAIVIMGLGLIMVATMFPVAWNRARGLTEYTTEVAVTEAAKMTIELLTRVDGPETRSDPVPPEAGSFAGDLIYKKDSLTRPEWIIAFSDTRVHALHLENLLVEKPEEDSPRLVPDRVAPLDSEHLPWDLERLGPGCTGQNIGGLGFDPRQECNGNLFFDDCEPLKSMFFNAQVWLESRVYPPMAEDLTPLEDEWYEVLDTRRYAWAVFHRLPRKKGPDQDPTCAQNDQDREEAEVAAHQAREFDMYYVTLKLSQQTPRYARQDTDPTMTPDFQEPFREVPVPPEALPPEDDVRLPSPWRVQVLFPDTLLSNKKKCNNAPYNVPPPTGIPTEIQVNPEDAETAAFVVDMFQEGTPFIDELSGQVYRVLRKRVLGMDRAVLTLDREILIEDIDDGYRWDDPLILDNYGNCVLEPEELLRTVWVFPPPVQADRAEEAPVFTGKQPVIAIEMRTLTRLPG